MPQFQFKACTKCGGDLAMDDGDWICLQCGRYYYVNLYQRPEPPAQTPARPTGRRPQKKGVSWVQLYPQTTGRALAFPPVLFASRSATR